MPTAFNGTTCFGEYTATLHMGTEGGNITLATADGPSSALCSDFMLFTSRERSVPVVHSSLDPSAGVTISSWAQYEYADVKEHGMDVFVMPCGVLGTVSSALKTVSLFNGKNYYEMQAANIDFLTERKIWQEAVVYNQTQDIDPSLIRSGDYFVRAVCDGACASTRCVCLTRRVAGGGKAGWAGPDGHVRYWWPHGAQHTAGARPHGWRAVRSACLLAWWLSSCLASCPAI